MKTKNKKCSKCEVVKSLDEFHKAKNKKYGRHSVCRECAKQYCQDNREKLLERSKQYAKDNKEKIKQYQQDNKEEISEGRRQYYQDNREAIAEWQKEYHQANKEKRNEQRRQYYQANKEKKHQYYQDNREAIVEYQKEYHQANKERAAEYRRNRYNNEPVVALRNNVSNLIGHALKRNDGSKVGESVLQYLPYTIEQLKEHLENQFEDWMTWSNRNEWHIDHIIPQSKLPYASMDEPNFQKCWSLENLQPLEAKENMSLGNREKM